MENYVNSNIFSKMDKISTLKFIREHVEIALEHYLMVREFLLGVSTNGFSDEFSNFPELSREEYDIMIETGIFSP